MTLPHLGMLQAMTARRSVLAMARDDQRRLGSGLAQRGNVSRLIHAMAMDHVKSKACVCPQQPPAICAYEESFRNETWMPDHRIWQVLVAQPHMSCGTRSQHRDRMSGAQEFTSERVDDHFLAAHQR